MFDWFKKPIAKEPPAQEPPVKENREALKKEGNALFMAGNLREAEACYLQAIALGPGAAEIKCNLGLLYQTLGSAEEAEKLFQEAVEEKPDLVPGWHNLGNLYFAQGKTAAAGDAFAQAIALDPKHAAAHANLGILVAQKGNLKDAEQLFRRASELDPENAATRNNHGNLLRQLGKKSEAEAAFRTAIRLQPEMASAHNNLGSLLQDEKRYEEAEASLRRAIELAPDFAEAHFNLANLQRAAGRDAESAYRNALKLKPDYPEALNNFASLLIESRRFAEAESLLRRAIELRLDYADAINNLGNLLKESGRFQEAEAAYRKVIDFPDARWNLALLLLTLGEYEEGWRFYEARHHPGRNSDRMPPPDLPFPQWQGEPLAGKSLLLCPEQGFGDYIQFIRYAPLLKKTGLKKLGLLCAQPLKKLLASATGVDEVYTETPPPHDYWAYPMSLPYHFDTTMDTIPAEVPYLHPPADRVERWRGRLLPPGFKVGLVWKGSASHKNDAHRSLPGITTLAPLWKVPGVTFISLQKGQGEDEAKNPPENQPLQALGTEIEDFADTAAIVSMLDLVITVDTAIAHVAGALGKSCWVLLPAIGADWRWLLDREDSPWYPSLRLFRQQTGWAPLVEALRQELARAIGKP